MSAKTKSPEPVTWEPNEASGALLGLLRCGEGKRAAVYAVAEVPTPPDMGRGFVLAKIDGGTDDEATGYAVRVSRAGRPESCECRGWLRWNHCRHTRAIGQLVANGQL